VTSYGDRARAYAGRVVAGEEVAGKLERLACQRFVDDLAREPGSDFPYVFDEARGARACRFVELLPHIKGEWARPTYRDGKLGYAKIALEDWQVFIVINLFGWVHMTTALRRFVRAYEEVARKNAKSTLAAALLLFMTTADMEPGAHTYSAATTGEQAREVFDVARNMALREPEFLLRFGVDVGKHDITIESSASSSKPLNAEGSTLDGLNVHFAVVDELHAHRTRAVYDVIDSATGARSQPMVMMITTAGSDTAGICYEQRDYTVKVLERSLLSESGTDDTWFGVIYALDDGDDWKDPAVWRKANPNLGVSVKLDDMEAACRRAKGSPGALAGFLTKRLNQWVGADTTWMPIHDWKACADTKLQLSDFEGRRCWTGLDLAEKRDFAAKVLVFPPEGDLEAWAVFVRLYLNEAAVLESGNAHLEGWARAGYVTVTDGNATDFDVIAEDMREDARRFDLQEIDYDPAMSRYFATKLAEEGLPMVEIRQAPMFFTQPLIQIANLVLERKVRHEGNPVMTWMISNVVVTTSKVTGLKHPTKSREENKIDGPVAMFLALGRAMLDDTGVHTQAFVSLNGAQTSAPEAAPA
jgi:phage terminase large subunit-like protein